MSEEVKFPRYIILGGTCAVCLVKVMPHGKSAKYYRDAGHWDVFVTRMDDGKLVCQNNKGPMTHVNGLEVFECTPDVWQKDNAGYLNGNRVL